MKKNDLSMSSKKLHSGQSLVEMGISFLILVLLLGGAVDFGRLFFAYIAIRDAAQEGATYLSLVPDDPAGMVYRVRHSSSTPLDLMGSDVGVSQVAGSCTDGYVRVRVTYKFNSIMPLMGAIFPGGIFNLASEITNSVLTSDCS
jgi:hypothetical protein